MSFVGPQGQDTQAVAVHHFRWMRLENAAQTRAVAAWQPWLETIDINGAKFFYYPDLVALWAQVMEIAPDAENPDRRSRNAIMQSVKPYLFNKRDLLLRTTPVR